MSSREPRVKRIATPAATNTAFRLPEAAVQGGPTAAGSVFNSFPPQPNALQPPPISFQSSPASPPISSNMGRFFVQPTTQKPTPPQKQTVFRPSIDVPRQGGATPVFYYPELQQPVEPHEMDAYRAAMEEANNPMAAEQALMAMRTNYFVQPTATPQPLMSEAQENERARAMMRQHFATNPEGTMQLPRGGTARYSDQSGGQMPTETDAGEQMVTLTFADGGSFAVPASRVESLLGLAQTGMTDKERREQSWMEQQHRAVRQAGRDRAAMPLGERWAEDHPEEASKAKKRIQQGMGTHRDYWLLGVTSGQRGEEDKVDLYNQQMIQQAAERSAQLAEREKADLEQKYKIEQILTENESSPEKTANKQNKPIKFSYIGDDGKKMEPTINMVFDPTTGRTVPEYNMVQQQEVDGWLKELGQLDQLEADGKTKVPTKGKLNPKISERRKVLLDRLSGYGYAYATDSDILKAVPDATADEIRTIRDLLTKGYTLDELAAQATVQPTR